MGLFTGKRPTDLGVKAFRTIITMRGVSRPRGGGRATAAPHALYPAPRARY